MGFFNEKRVPVVLDCSCDEPITEQSHRDGCDINNMLKKYSSEAISDGMPQYDPKIQYVPEADFQESMNIVIKGQSAFKRLPAKLRSRFNNDPVEFLEFVNNPDSADEMISLGLAKKPVKPEIPVVRIVNESQDVPAASGPEQSGGEDG